MKAVILSDVAVSPPAVGGAKAACAFPSVCRLTGGGLVCVYRRGKEKHSRDGLFVAQRSADDGRSWSEPVTIFDGMARNPPESAHGGAVGETEDGTILAMFTAVPAVEGDSYIFSEAGRQWEQTFYVARSRDQGRTWEPARALNPPGTPALRYINSRPLPLPGGDLLVPIEVTTPSRRQAIMASRYRGSDGTFEPAISCADDATGRLSFGDPKLVRAPDGRILMWLWAFINATEETIQAHECVSADDGRSWSPPRPLPITCQCSALLTAGDGSLIAVGNVRHPPEGIRLWRSPDGGKTWDPRNAVQMWDARSFKMLGQPIAAEPSGKSPDDGRLWESLPGFTFGTPDLVPAGGKSALLTYYVVDGGFAQVRACRFELS